MLPVIWKATLPPCPGRSWHSRLSSANGEPAPFPGAAIAPPAPLHQATFIARLFLLPTLAPWKKNTRPLYYFKTCQITLLLSAEISRPKRISYPTWAIHPWWWRPVVREAPRPHTVVYPSHSKAWLEELPPRLSLHLLFFLLGLEVPPFSFCPAIGFSLL